MTNMVRLTNGQRLLASGVILFGAVLTPIAFTVMYVTVTDLLRPWFGDLAWTVPVGTEAGFIGLFLADLLLEWIRKPLWWLPAVPYLLAAVSIALNALAGAHAPADILGHEVLPVVFFGYLIAAKAVMRRLALTDEGRQHEVALRDARAHARDMLRSALGIGWHFRAPVLLRRQLRSGRLPATVLGAVDQGARFGGATVWEPAVEAWITSAVTLPERAREQVRAARQAVPAPAPEPAASEPESAPADSVQARPRARSARASRPALKLTAAKSRGMTPERLAEHVSAMLDAYGDGVSVNRIKADLSVGTEKAKAALEIARRDRARVVPFGERKQA